MTGPHQKSPLFPTTAPSKPTLGGARQSRTGRWTLPRVFELFPSLGNRARNRANKLSGGEQQMLAIGRALMTDPDLDRKSTRLNSSHSQISYAVFCLKKKKIP